MGYDRALSNFVGSLGRAAERSGEVIAGAILSALLVSVIVDVGARWFGLPLTGGLILATWLVAFLAMIAAFSLIVRGSARPGILVTVLSGFALGTLLSGLVSAAAQIGGTAPVLGVPVAWRYAGCAFLLSFALCIAVLQHMRTAVCLAAGAVAAFLAPPLPPLAGTALFAIALALRTPAALALLAAVATAPGALSDAAFAQTVLRGLSPAVIIAVPLFVLAASLMVVGGVGDAIAALARSLGRARATAPGEANVFASVLFGGVSGSGIADAALGARLIAPSMVRAGYSPADASALTAASAVVPNLIPPSIALLLAAAATDQSVGALWVAGIGAGIAAASCLWLAVRFRPPMAAAPTGTGAFPRPSAVHVAMPLTIAVGVLGGLRLGLVTPTEAGAVAVVLAGTYALVSGGISAVLRALRDAALQAGRIALLIAAAAPVSFLIATSGIAWAALVPSGATALPAAALLCLLIGTVLDVGAAILLLLPLLLPALVSAGVDPVHATLVLVTALLIGGLTPPVGILVLSVREITGARGIFRATVPYLCALIGALAVLVAAPSLTAGLSRLL